MTIDYEPTWDTLEVGRWIDNTEPLYHAAKACRTADDYRDGFANLLADAVDIDEVDWDYIAEDRA